MIPKRILPRRTLVAWQRMMDGGYDESHHRNETVRPAHFAGVAMEIEHLFD